MIPRARACACEEDWLIKQSALFHRHQQSGASWIEHYGWHVPACFTTAEDEVAGVRGAAGLADLSWMQKFDLKGYGLKNALSLPAGVSPLALAPLHMVITCDPSAQKAVIESLQAIQATGSGLALPPPVYVTDVTSVYAQFLVAGPRCRDILSKLTSLNLSESSLPDLSCGQASLAHVHAIILRKDSNGVPAYHLLVSREYGESIWDSVLHAGDEFHIAPFGLEAQQLLSM
jgi:aminomethyltransferase